MILDRVSLNGKRYVVTEYRHEAVLLCHLHRIPTQFIRRCKVIQSRFFGQYYLRLWGRYKHSLGGSV